MILPEIRDRRFITIRRGGTLTDEDHRLLAAWAADCANHVLHLFEEVRPDDDRPRRAMEAVHAWVNGKIKMMQARDSCGYGGCSQREPRNGQASGMRVAAWYAPQKNPRACYWR